MANLKASKKDVKRSRKRAAYNGGVKSAIKTYIKKARKAFGTADSAPSMISAVKMLDKAAANGVIHKKQAARRKSRLMRAAKAETKA